MTEFATKFVLYAGLVASVGVWAAGKSASRIALPHRLAVRCRIVGSSVVVLASVVQLIVHAGESGESVAVVATSGFGVVVWVRVAAVVAVSLPLPSAITAAAVAVVGWTVAWNGHGGAGTWWYSVSTTVHVVASTVWLGGIFCLLVAVTRRRDHRAEQVRQWSTVALVCSALVVLTGVVQGVVQVEFPAALVTTGYGLVLVVKVVAVASMLLIAWRVSGRAVGIRPTLVRVELAVSAVVLVCAGILSSIAPAAASFRPAETGTLAVGPYALSLSISPARTGSQQIAVRAVPDGGALTAQSISATLSSADSDISGIAVDFPVRATEPSGPGEVPVVVFHSSAVSVPAGGEWTLQLTVVADRLHQYAGSFVYDVH